MARRILEVEELEAIVEEFIAPIGDIEAELGTDFYSFPYDNVIQFAIFVKDNSDKYFQNFVDTAFPLAKGLVGTFMWSVLHEVGHIMTDKEVTEEEENFSDKVKNILNNREKLEDLDYYVYFYLADEYKATEWAYHYIMNNLNRVLEYENKIYEKVLNFVEKYVDETEEL